MSEDAPESESAKNIALTARDTMAGGRNPGRTSSAIHYPSTFATEADTDAVRGRSITSDRSTPERPECLSGRPMTGGTCIRV